jgi:hypothetical protein
MYTEDRGVNKTTIMSSLTILGILLGVHLPAATAQILPKTLAQNSAVTPHPDPHASEAGGGFQRIEQPLWRKALVTAGGLGLIGLELWWFLVSTPKSGTAPPQGKEQAMPVNRD